MKIRHVSGAFSLFLFFCISAHAEIDPLQVWTASGGEARLELRADYLPDFGLEIVHDGRAAHGVVEIRRGFTDSDQLIIEAPYGNFERFVTGEIRLDTGWVLRYEGREVRLDGLTLTPGIDPDNGHPTLEARDPAGRHLLTFHHIHILAEHERELLTLHNMDFSAEAALAELLEMPDLDGMVLGGAWLDLPMHVPEGANTTGRDVEDLEGGLSCTGRPFWPQDFQTHGETIDVSLIGMSQIAYQGTDGATGRIKVAPSATLKNVSAGDVPWIPKFDSLGSYPHAPPDQHPFLVFNMYRVADGRIQQLGASGVKHAFLTLNQSCDTSCGYINGNILPPNCEDVYSTGNNDSNFNLGPREDIEASVGYFDSCNSFFSPGAGCSQTQNSTSYQNRLMIDPGQLQTAGAEYFFDAWYVIQYDTDIWNSMGYRPINPTPSGSGWIWNPGPYSAGRTLDQWVDPDNPGPNEDHAAIVVPSATPGEPYPDNMPQGHINVAVKVTETANGFRYNYAVQNFDFERGIEAFRIPVNESATIFEEFFGDIDEDEDNDWTISVQDGYVNFEAPQDNPLTWFTVFNFEIETDAPPTASQATLDLGGDAVVPSIDADILGPEQGPVPLPDDITLEPVFPGVSLNFPVALRHAGDGSGRKFIVERGTGQIRIIDADGNLLPDEFLDVSGDTSTATSGERGLLGLAFHPDYANNGLFYINHTADNMAGITNGDTVIAEFQVSAGDPDIANPASRRNLMVIPQDASNHNGGDLHFGPDGYLYVGMGDGGSANDPCNRGQTLDPSTGTSCRPEDAAWLLGKMLRIDVDNTTPAGSNNLCAAAGDGSAEYAIPGDNPFAGDTDACGEVWAYGMRNPYRFSFDRDTGDLWIGDVGQGTWEEIDFEPAGGAGGNNYGWKVCEGTWMRGSTTTPCNLSGHTPPVLEYSRSTPHCSVTGGFRYRGPFPSLEGFYAYGDYCSGQLWLAQEAGGDWVTDEFDNVGFGLVGFGEDEAGHLYLLKSGGEILRFEGEPDPAPVVAAVNPDEGPETGGTSVTLTGENFLAGAEVTFGGNDCASIDVVSDTEITCDTPPGAPGSVDVTVTNPDTQADTLIDGFTYTALPPAITSVDPGEGPETGGTSVTLTGENFLAGAGVTFGGNDCAGIDVVSDTEITCNTPPGAPGTVDVTVTNPDDQSDALSGGFTYIEVVDPVPALSLSTDLLDFGTVEVGTQSDPLDVVLTSTGTGTLEVSGLVGPGALFSVDASDCGGTPFSLAPSEECLLSVTFWPTFEGEVSDEVMIESNADSSPDTVALTGTGFQEQAPGELAVVPDSVDFGDVAVDDSDTAFVTVSNVAPEGAAALSLDMPEIITGGDDFEIVGNDCGATLAAQTSCEVEIQFTPTEEIAYAGILRIAADEATVNVTLAGNGGAAGPVIFEDRFEELALLLRGVLIGW